jgi:IS30 family transposase
MKNKYKHITLGDRRLIQTQLQQGFSPAAIAESLGRHRSSITQELAGNGWKPVSTMHSVGRLD